MIWLFVFLGLIGLFYWLFRRVVVSLIAVVVRKIFKKDFTFEPGDKFLSLKKFVAKSPYYDFDIEDSQLKISLLSLFNLSNEPFLSITSEKCHITLNRLKFVSEDEEPTTFKKWSLEKIGTLIFAFLFKRAYLDCKNISLKYQGSHIKSSSLTILFMRNLNGLYLDVTSNEIITGYNVPIVRIPNLKFEVFLNGFALKHLFGSLFHTLTVTIERIFFKMKYGKITLSITPIEISCSNDKTVEGKITFKQIDSLITQTTFNTKSIKLAITSISASEKLTTTGNVICKSSSTTIALIPSLEYKLGILRTTSIELKITTSVLLDIAMIYQIFPHSLDPSNPSHFFLPFTAKSDNVSISVALSDNYNYHAYGTGFKAIGNVIKFKEAVGQMLVSKDYMEFIRGTELKIQIVNEMQFIISTKTASLSISNEFAFQSYILVTIRILKYIQFTMKGPNYQINPEVPPTPFDIIYDSSLIKISLKKVPLLDSIECSNEAKRISMEGLMIRQEKAMHVIKTKGIESINEDEFVKKSRELLFSVYKTIRQHMEEKRDFMALEAENVHIRFNGLAFSNRQSAIESAVLIYPNIESSKISDIDAGILSITSTKAKIDANRHDGFLKGRRIKIDATICVVPKIVDKKKDLFYYVVDCDGGSIQIRAPDCTQSSSIIIEGKIAARECQLLLTPTISEFLKDYDFATLNALRKPFRYKNTHGLDTIFIDNHIFGVVDIDHLKIKCNSKADPYSDTPLAIITMPHFSFGLKNKTVSIKADQTSLDVLLSGSHKRFIRAPKWIFKLDFETFNELGEAIVAPAFIDIESCRIMDPSYDPFERLRTHRMEIISTLDFGQSAKEHMHVNFDLAQSIIDEVFSVLPTGGLNLDIFNSTPGKSLSFSLQTFLKLPSIDIHWTNDEYITRLTNESSVFSYESGVIPSLAFKIDKTDAIFTSFGMSLGVASVTNIEITSKNGNVRFGLGEFNADVHMSFVQMAMQIGLKVPKDPAKKLPPAPATLNSENIKAFVANSQSDIFDIGKVSIHLIDSRETAPFFSLDGFSYQNIENESGERIFMFEFRTMTVITRPETEETPLIRLDDIKVWFGLDDERASAFIDMMGSLNFHIRPEDFDLVFSYVRAVMPAALKPKLEKKSGNPLSMSFIVRIAQSVTANFMKDIHSKLARVDLAGFDFVHMSDIDGQEVTSVKLQKIMITDETVSNGDEFHDVVKNCKEDENALSVRVQVGRRRMKCPVFNLIDVTVAPFYLRVSMIFMDTMIKFFPSTSDFNIFDFDQTDEEGETTSAQVFLGGQSNVDDLVGFYRKISVKPFTAVLSYRGTPDMIIKEILARNFVFSAIELTDTFGTRDQLKHIVKHQLKWNLIKAIPKLIVNRSK